MPCDPEERTEWVTDSPVTTSRKVSLQDPGGALGVGYLATVLTKGSRELRGYVPHWATCPKSTSFKPGGELR